MDKGALRKRYRQERSLMNPGSIDLSSWNHILEMPELTGANIVASYYSYGDEPNTSVLNKEIISLGKSLVLPRTLPDLNLEWVLWSGDEKNLINRAKVKEPKGDLIDENKIDFVIIPTLHVTREGFRLGQGGGSYDRALVSMRAFRLGLIYSGEITSEPFPVESFDQKLNAVATPELIVRF